MLRLEWLIRARGFNRLDDLAIRRGAPSRATLHRVLARKTAVTDAFVSSLAQVLKVDEALILELVAEDGLERAVQRARRMPHLTTAEHKGAELEASPARSEGASRVKLVMTEQKIAKGERFEVGGVAYVAAYVSEQPDGSTFVRGKRVTP